MTLQGRIYTISKQGQELDANAKFLSMIQESVDNDVVVIDGRNIAAGSIYASQIHSDSITADHLRADAITSDHITAGVITGDKITSGVIRSQDNSMEIDLNNGTINLTKPLVIDSRKVATEEFVETNLADTVKSIVEEFAQNTNPTTPPAQSSIEWKETPPTWQDGKFIWSRTKITYKNKPMEISKPVNITGSTGKTGTSVESVTEYYLATSASSGIKSSNSGFKTTMQPMTPTNKYLWNYEEINFSDGTNQPTVPVIIGVYGNKGEAGSTGATGRSITSITEHYLVTSANSGVTRSTSGWDTKMKPTTETERYLWNYETINWSSGTTPTYVDPIIIGVHGAKGDQGPRGVSITKVDVEYAQSTSETTAPTSGWNTTAPDWENGMYIWSRTVTTYSSGNPTQSKPAVITGQKGSTGAPGSTGATGTGVSSISEEYAISTSKTSAPASSSFSATRPDWKTGQYIWTRSKIVYKNPTSTSYTEPVVSSEWEAINDLEIGGRNLLPNTDETTEYTSASGTRREFFKTEYDFAPIFDRYGLIEYTLSFELKSEIAGNINVYMQNGSGAKYSFSRGLDATTEWKEYTVTFKPTLSDDTMTESYLAFYGTYDSGRVPTVRKLKLEKGSKATDWTEAPEDVQERIGKKADIEAVDNLKNETIPALKDGLMNSSEKEAVRQSLNVVSADKKGIDMQYTTVYANTALTGTAKTNLNSSKVALNTAFANLQSAISAVLAVGDGTRITTAQMTLVTTRLDAYGTALSAYNQRYEQAQDAISTKYVDDVEIGGKNLIVQSNITRGKFLTVTGSESTNASWFYTDFIPVSNYKNLVTSGYSNLGSGPSVIYYNSSKAFVKGINNGNLERAKNITIDSGIAFIRFSGMIVDLPTLKLEKGNKATDWTPAPEDVEKAYTDVAEAKANLAETEAKAYADGKVTEEEERAIQDAKDKLAEAKAHADDKAETAETNAKDYTKEQVDDIEVGGRNLLVESELIRGRFISNLTTYQGEASGSGFFITPPKPIDGAKYLTASITVSSSAANLRIIFLDSNLEKISYYQNANVLSHTWEVPSNAEYYVFCTHDLDGNKYKLEKGNKATDWTEAPEDTQLDINKKTYNAVRYIRDWANGSTANTGNHWGEIQAIQYSTGENIAKGKPVTSNGTLSNSTRVTDGVINTSYANGPAGYSYVQLDLGQVYYDIESVLVSHYYVDGRTYHQTKTEVSADGVNWVPVFDSVIEGEYEETSSGKISPNTQAKAESLFANQETMKRLGDPTSKVTIDGGHITAGQIKSKNNYSWISLENGQFNLGNGGLIYNSSGLTVNGKLSVTNLQGEIPKTQLDSETQSQITAGNTAKSTLDSKESIWDAKETTSGAQAKATAAETNAKKYVDDNTGNLVNNPAATGNHTGWTGSGLSSLNQTFEGVSTRVLQSSTGSNIQNYSSYFKVDPSKAYEVSMWFKKSIANSGGYYFGLNGVNASGSAVGFVHTSQSGGVANANNTNFYFQSGTPPTDWVKAVGYIMPVGTNPSDLDGVGTSSNAIMKQNIDRIRVRFLNWGNGGTTRELWVANPKVVEVDPNAIIYSASAKKRTDAWSWNGTTEIDGTSIRTRTITANEIKSKTITTEELNITTLSAITANLGTVTAGTIRSKDNAIDINLDTGTINLSRPLTINQLPVSTKKEVEDAIQNIEVGGRNLIRNSSFNGEDHWLGSAEIDTEVKFSDNNTLKFQQTSTATRIYKDVSPNSRYKAKQGDTLTLSFYVMTNDVANMSTIWVEKKPNSGYEEIAPLSIPEGTKNGEWVKMSATYTIDGDATMAGLYIAKLVGTTPTFWISDIKIEKGNTATDWTPAPEDVEASYKSYADGVVDDIELGGRNYFSYLYHSDRTNFEFVVDKNMSIEPLELEPNTQYMLSYSDLSVIENGQYRLAMLDSTGEVALPIFEIENETIDEHFGADREIEFVTDDSGMYNFSYYVNGIDGTIIQDDDAIKLGEWFTEILVGFQIEQGNISTDYKDALEDTQMKIDKKADAIDLDKYLPVEGYEDDIDEINTSLQSYMSILEQSRDDIYGLYETELDEDGNEVQTNILVTDEDGEIVKAGVIAEISDLLNRSVAIENNLEGFTETWNFLETKIIMGENGMLVGEYEHQWSEEYQKEIPVLTSGIMIGSDRIDFVNGNHEEPVAFITGNVLQINHGIFVKTLQVGEHKLETRLGGHTIWQWIDPQN